MNVRSASLLKPMDDISTSTSDLEDRPSVRCDCWPAVCVLGPILTIGGALQTVSASSNTRQCPVVVASRCDCPTIDPASTFIGTTYRVVGSGQRRWIVRPYWSRQRRLQGPQRLHDRVCPLILIKHRIGAAIRFPNGPRQAVHRALANMDGPPSDRNCLCTASVGSVWVANARVTSRTGDGDGI